MSKGQGLHNDLETTVEDLSLPAYNLQPSQSGSRQRTAVLMTNYQFQFRLLRESRETLGSSMKKQKQSL